MTTEADKAARLVEHVLAGLNETDPAGLVASIREANALDELDAEYRVDPEEEYRIEAEAIARGIRHAEQGRGMLDRREIAAIVESVIEHYFEVRTLRREARAIADAILEGRVFDLVGDAVAEAAAHPLGDGRAVLHRHKQYVGEFPAVELTPERTAAARLLISIDFRAQVTCMVEGGTSHEIFSTVPAEIADEVRLLVAALVAGTYYEEARDKRHSTTIKAFWPGGHSTTVDATQDAGGPLTEWRKRAYDPY